MIPSNWAEILQGIKPFGETDIGALLNSAGSLAGFSAANLENNGRSLGRFGGIREFAQGDQYALPFSGATLSVIYDTGKPPEAAATIAALANVLDLALLVTDRRETLTTPLMMEPTGAKDPLTKTIDRVAFTDFLNIEFASAPAAASVILIGLDRTEAVQATFGHSVADAVLAEVADRFRETLRSCDTISRVDSDVFAVYCPEVSLDVATTLAMRLQEVVHIPIRVGDNELRVTACAGIATRSKGEKAAEILEHGSAALRASREGGPGELSIYDGELQMKTEDRRQLASELIDAFSNNELATHRSPIVHLPEGAVTGVEAQVIWNHRTHGQIDSATFMDLAEMIGRVGDVERSVLEFSLLGDGTTPTGMNLSASTLRDFRSVSSITERLKQSDSKVKFEVGEDAIALAGRAAAQHLQMLRDAGAAIVLDDFGKTSGSLRTLHTIPLDGLKLHSSILNPEDPTRATSVAKAVYASANELQLQVVHSGVDTDADLRFLLTLDAQISGRGFLAQGAAVASRVRTPKVA